MEQLRILKHYPYLVPRNRNYTLYEGFICVQKEEYNIKLHIPNYPKLEGIDITVSNHGFPINIDLDQLNLNVTLFEFLQQLEKRLIPVVSQNIQQNTKMNFNFMKDCKNLILKYDLKLHIKADMTRIIIRDNNHFLKLEYSEKGTYIMNKHSFPEFDTNETCKRFKDGLSLENLYKIFKHNLQMLERFNADLDEIDLVCSVIDPLNPTTKDTHRQILLGDNTSMIIQLSPWNYGEFPNLKFIGPTRETEKFTERVSRNLQNWNTEVNLFRNLLSLLDLMYFPSKQKSDNISNEEEVVMFDGECCICFASKLNDKLPNVVCENKHCGQHFHSECLYEWLSSIDNGRNIASNYIEGNCLNCEQRIFCPVPS